MYQHGSYHWEDGRDWKFTIFQMNNIISENLDSNFLQAPQYTFSKNIFHLIEPRPISQNLLDKSRGNLDVLRT